MGALAVPLTGQREAAQEDDWAVYYWRRAKERPPTIKKKGKASATGKGSKGEDPCSGEKEEADQKLTHVIQAGCCLNSCNSLPLLKILRSVDFWARRDLGETTEGYSKNSIESGGALRGAGATAGGLLGLWG